MRGLVLAALLLASRVGATTFYVDPATGNDANAGTSTGAAWRSPPGTRLPGNTDYWGAFGLWGSISQSNKIKCNDIILLKGGSTQTSTQGGAWLISPDYYTRGCTATNPITIRVASNTPGEWVGSTGPFTLNLTGVTGTCQEPPGFCNGGVNAGIYVTAVDGVFLGGINASQRLIVTNGSSATWQIMAACNVNGGSCATGQHDFRGDWWELTNGFRGFDVGTMTNWQVSNSIAHNLLSDAWATGIRNDNLIAQGAYVDVQAYDNGCGSVANPSCTSGQFSDAAFNLVGGRSFWCVRCQAYRNGVQAFSPGDIHDASMGGDFVYRFRDLESHENGSTPSANLGNSCGGFKISGNDFANTDRDRAYLLGAKLWGNRNFGAIAYGAGVLEAWNADTFFTNLLRADFGSYLFDLTEAGTSIFNGVDVRANSATNCIGQTQNAGLPQGTRTALAENNCWRPLQFDTEGLGSSGYPGAGTYAAPPSWVPVPPNRTTLASCNPRFVVQTQSSWAANDWRPCEANGSPDPSCTQASDVIDQGRSYLLTNGAGSGNTVTVKSNGGSSDPRNYFIEPASYLSPAASDMRVQIQGACGVRHVVSMTSSTITFDGASCSWSGDAMVHTPWNGAAPDMGAIESFGAATTTSTSTSSSTSTSTTSSTSTSATSITTTTARTTSTSTSTSTSSSSSITATTATTTSSTSSSTLTPSAQQGITLRGGTFSGVTIGGHP